MKIGRPTSTEAAAYYFRYIDLAPGEDPIAALRQQCDVATAALSAIPEQESLYRYAPDKWSIREVVNHINDAERLFSFRALWFARGFADPLPSFEQSTATAHAESDRIAFSAHVAEFQNLRRATLSLFENLPASAWTRTGSASGNLFTVRALAFVIVGHCTHHLSIIQQRYLSEGIGKRQQSGSRR